MIKFNKSVHLLKNLLIFFPLLISNKQIDFESFKILTSGLLSFSIITILVYNINDLTDRDIDKINVLKTDTKTEIKSKNAYYLVYSFILLVSLLLIDFINCLNEYLILYVLFFLLYNFYFKHFFGIDIVLLSSFYILRCYYGVELVNLKISPVFFSFILSIFILFSIYKRVSQIRSNKLTKKNKIIPYFLIHLPSFKKISIALIFFNIMISFVFLFNHLVPESIQSILFNEFTITNKSIFLSTLTLCLGVYIHKIIYSKIFDKKTFIKKDIFLLVVTNSKIVIMCMLILILILFNFVNLL